MNRTIKCSFVIVGILFIAACVFGSDQPPNLKKFNFDHLVLDKHVVTLTPKSNPIDPPYTVEPSTGKYFACAPGRRSYYGYRADNDIGWFYYLKPNTDDSLVIDFDFNVHYALDDTFMVLALLDPDEKGTFWYGVEYRLEYPEYNTENEWVTISEVLENGLHFVPAKDSVLKYGPITYIAFRFKSNSIRNGIDGFGFGVGIDNVKINIFKNGGVSTMFDNFEDEAAYRGPAYNIPAQAIDFIPDPGESPDRWAWIDDYLYTPIAAVNASTWQNVKQGK